MISRIDPGVDVGKWNFGKTKTSRPVVRLLRGWPCFICVCNNYLLLCRYIFVVFVRSRCIRKYYDVSHDIALCITYFNEDRAAVRVAEKERFTEKNKINNNNNSYNNSEHEK